MEINEDKPKEHRGYSFRACFSKGVSHHHLHWAETQDKQRSRESFIGVGAGVGGVLEVYADWRSLAWGKWRWVT